MNNVPNFFVVGGPKCGTTATVEYLRTHPDIFISEPKEPNFLADNMPNIKFVNNLKGYLNLFKKATNFKVIGDASIFYMFSKIAINNIYKLNPNAKLLVMLRNPIEMVPSFHLQILFTMEEDEEDFSKVLKLEKYRKRNKNVPKYNRDSKLLNYSEIAKYGEQLENIYKFFPEDQVKIVLFDDFKKNNSKVYLEILYFLNLTDDGRTDFPKINEAKKAKSKLVNRIINRPPKIATKIARFLRKMLNKPRLGILSRASHLNRTNIPRLPISENAKNELILMYKEDILKTQKIINRDLSHWLT